MQKSDFITKIKPEEIKNIWLTSDTHYRWNLYENGEFIDSFPSHTKAKNAMHWKIVEAKADMLDLYYTIKKVEVKHISTVYYKD